MSWALTIQLREVVELELCAGDGSMRRPWAQLKHAL